MLPIIHNKARAKSELGSTWIPSQRVQGPKRQPIPKAMRTTFVIVSKSILATAAYMRSYGNAECSLCSKLRSWHMVHVLNSCPNVPCPRPSVINQKQNSAGLPGDTPTLSPVCCWVFEPERRLYRCSKFTQPTNTHPSLGSKRQQAPASASLERPGILPCCKVLRVIVKR